MAENDIAQRIEDALDARPASDARRALRWETDGSPAAARAFDEALRLEALLHAAHAPAPDEAAVCVAIRQRLAAEPFRAAARHRATLRRLAAAAALAVAVGGGLWMAGVAHRPAVHSVIEGQATVGQSAADIVADGETVRTAVDSRAVLSLADGSRMELAPDSAVVVHGRQGRVRQTVELLQGEAGFAVSRGHERFRVITHVGSVTVLGTEFNVGIQRVAEKGKENGMNGRMVMAMAVAVTMGSVRVQVGNQSVVLSAGQSQVFAEEGGKGPQTKQIRGTVASVSGQTLNLNVGQGKEGQATEVTQSVTLDASTSILVESDEMESGAGEGGKTKQRRKLVPGTTADLVAGKRVSVTEANGMATKVVIQATEAKRSGGEGERKSGEGEAVKPAKRSGGEGERGEEAPKPRKSGGEGERKSGGESKKSGEEGKSGGESKEGGAKTGSGEKWW